ncbi:MAG: TPM domain-containing protein [Muribaculaceae bacterium]|nr:TPM domain-containing protein [Muribaculaceae bacterium]
MTRILALIIICLSSFSVSGLLWGKDYLPEDLINPNVADRSQYVADPAGLVGEDAKRAASRSLWNLRQTTGAEVVVVVVPNTGGMSREEFGVKLFDLWKPGKADNDNGAIILIVPDQREAWIATGYGLEGVIPDIAAAKIVNRSVVPFMKENNLDGAVRAVAADVAAVLTDPQAAEEIKSKKGESWENGLESDITEEDLLAFVGWVVFGLFLISLIKYFYDSRHLGKLDRYSQARGWHDSRTTYLLLAVFSLGLGLIPFWLSRRKYNKARNNPIMCPTCRTPMHKLNEEEDNRYLSPSQDLEERLNSVDYDVWVCPECSTVERYAFPNKFTNYTECPHCHTVAMHLVKDHVVSPATTRHTGIGERVYECKYCHNQTRKRYTIPQKTDKTAAALAAGAIMGSGRGGGFGGGGFGGGFGGGRTGGGGGGGRW